MIDMPTLGRGVASPEQKQADVAGKKGERMPSRWKSQMSAAAEDVLGLTAEVGAHGQRSSQCTEYMVGSPSIS